MSSLNIYIKEEILQINMSPKLVFDVRTREQDVKCMYV